MTGNTTATPETIITAFALFALVIGALVFPVANGTISPIMLIAGIAICTALVPVSITMWVIFG